MRGKKDIKSRYYITIVASFLMILSIIISSIAGSNPDNITINAPFFPSDNNANWSWQINENEFCLYFFDPNTTVWHVDYDGKYNYSDRFQYNYTGLSQNAYNMSFEYNDFWEGPENDYCAYRRLEFTQLSGETACLWFSLFPNLTNVTVGVGEKTPLNCTDSGGPFDFCWGLSRGGRTTYVLRDISPPNITWLQPPKILGQSYIDFSVIILDEGYYAVPLNYLFHDTAGKRLPLYGNNSWYDYKIDSTYLQIWARMKQEWFSAGNHTVVLLVNDYSKNSVESEVSFLISELHIYYYLIPMIIISLHRLHNHYQ